MEIRSLNNSGQEINISAASSNYGRDQTAGPVLYSPVCKSMALSDNIDNSTGNSNYTNSSAVPQGLPEEMVFGVQHIISIAAYSCFFVVAASGNLTVFITLFRNRNIKSRVNMFIMHLSIADLIVTFIMMPLEIAWHITVEWRAGDIECRILMFFRAFGLYLSSFVLVVISLDRYFAILHPLSLNDADKRGKIMLFFAWSFSIIASLPQSVIFHEESHPQHPWFKQCVTFNFFPTDTHELIYNLFNMLALYGIPLIIICLSYGLILREISKKTRQSKEELEDLNSSQTRSRLRRSAVGNIERARTRTLKMTIVIVSVFVFCWTPYFVLAVWYWFDRESARTVDPRIQKGLFMFAVSNSCVNPIVYGLFTINFKREFVRCCCCLKSSWGQKKLMAFAGNYLSRTNQKTGYSRTSYSSVRTSANSVTMKSNTDKIYLRPDIVRYSALSKSDSSKSSNGPSAISVAGSQHSAPEARVNMNNFISVQLSDEESKDRVTGRV